MIEKPKRQKQLNNQDRQLPSNIQELINRYDLDNTKIYEFLDDVVEYFSPIDIEGDNVAIGQKYDTSEGSKLQVNGDISLTNRADGITINGHKGILRHWTGDTQISANDGVIFLRPKGNENTTNQVIVNNEGNTDIAKTSGDAGYYAKRSDTGVQVWMGVGSGGTNHGVYSNKLNKWIVYADASNVYLNGVNSNKFTPVSLYDNSSGTTGTVTLSETAANFSYLEIFYGKKGEIDNMISYNSTKVFSANGKKTNIVLMYRATGDTIQLNSAEVSISGTNISKKYYFIENFQTNGTIEQGNASDNSIKIYKVIGYR